MLNTTLKQFSMCSWKMGTLVFATLNLVVWATGVIGGFVGFLATYGYWSQFDLTVLSLGCCLGSGFLLVFAGFLYYGILEKRPQLIKTYFVFGAVMLSLSCFSFLAFALGFLDMPQFPSWVSAPFAMIVIGQVVYALVLAMIYKTYKKMEEDEDDQRHFLVGNMTETTFMTLPTHADIIKESK